MYSTVVYLKRALLTQARKIRAVVSEQQSQQVIFNNCEREKASSDLIKPSTLAQRYQGFHLLWGRVTQTMTY